MGFDAGKAVEPLDFDFTAFGGPEGVIPEPSTGQVDDFFDELKSLAHEAKGMLAMADKKKTGEMSEQDAVEFLSTLDDDMVQKFRDRMINALDKLCGGTPSRTDIEALPYRVLNAFNAWLGGALRPEAPKAVTIR
jgi:hypothetical protein